MRGRSHPALRRGESVRLYNQFRGFLSRFLAISLFAVVIESTWPVCRILTSRHGSTQRGTFELESCLLQRSHFSFVSTTNCSKYSSFGPGKLLKSLFRILVELQPTKKRLQAVPDHLAHESQTRKPDTPPGHRSVVRRECKPHSFHGPMVMVRFKRQCRLASERTSAMHVAGFILVGKGKMTLRLLAAAKLHVPTECAWTFIIIV